MTTLATIKPTDCSRFSANQFKSNEDISFSKERYSRFKFGSKNAARHMGTEMGQKFIESAYYMCIKFLLRQKECNRVIVLSSPYEHVPTATFALKDYFIRVLNESLIEEGLLPVLEGKVYRKSSYKDDYGAMSKEERFALMSDDEFYVDKTILKNNVCLFIDDIRITGAHEYHVVKMLDSMGVNGRKSANVFLYYAELTNETCDPNIENYLNYFVVKGLLDLNKIINDAPFILNTRVVKYILNSQKSDFEPFCQYQKQQFLQTLYHAAIGNCYHLIDDYKDNLNFLKSVIK